jgi:hypothetical protein
VFFSEEKNQKTVDSAPVAMGVANLSGQGPDLYAGA